MTTGRVLEGPCGTATEILFSDPANPDWAASVASWFLHCPGQSPAWDNYALGVVHLREVEGQSRPAIINIPGATHEVILFALDPLHHPVVTDPLTWSSLRPLNVVEQIQLPSDDAARDLASDCALAVVTGILPAEPPLSGQVEPWRTTLLKTSAHLRGEEHAP